MEHGENDGDKATLLKGQENPVADVNQGTESRQQGVSDSSLQPDKVEDGASQETMSTAQIQHGHDSRSELLRSGSEEARKRGFCERDEPDAPPVVTKKLKLGDVVPANSISATSSAQVEEDNQLDPGGVIEEMYNKDMEELEKKKEARKEKISKKNEERKNIFLQVMKEREDQPDGGDNGVEEVDNQLDPGGAIEEMYNKDMEELEKKKEARNEKISKKNEERKKIFLQEMKERENGPDGGDNGVEEVE